MRFQIIHEIKGRIRIHILQTYMSDKEADTLQYYLDNSGLVQSAKVYERTQDAVICYKGSRQELLKQLQQFSYEAVQLPESVEA